MALTVLLIHRCAGISLTFIGGTMVDTGWIIWQAVVPLSSPFIVWFVVCLARSSLTNAPKLRNLLKTWKSVIEEYGWLMYAVFVSLQSGVAISGKNTSPAWIFWLNLAILLGSLIILAIAYVARFDDTKNPEIIIKPASDAPIRRLPAAMVALAAATVGYLTMSTRNIL